MLSWESSPARLYNGLDTHADGLLIGCVIALSSPVFRRIYWVFAIIFFGIAFTAKWNAQWMLSVGYSLVAICSGAGLLIALNPPNVISRFLNSWPVQWVGLRSYGIYLWHYPIVMTLAEMIGGGKRSLILAAGLTFLMAELSYRCVETPSAKIGHRFGRSLVKRPPNFQDSQEVERRSWRERS